MRYALGCTLRAGSIQGEAVLCGRKPEEGAKEGLADGSDASMMRLQEGRPISFRSRGPGSKEQSLERCRMSWEGGHPCIRARALITIPEVEEKGRTGAAALGEVLGGCEFRLWIP